MEESRKAKVSQSQEENGVVKKDKVEILIADLELVDKINENRQQSKRKEK